MKTRTELSSSRKCGRRWIATPVLAVGVAAVLSFGLMSAGDRAQGATTSMSAAVPDCNLRLPSRTNGSPLFAVPAGGRATLRFLAGRLRLCTLLRADGSRFASARIDQLQQLLEMRFFRRSGTLLVSAESQHPATSVTEGAEVSCASSAHSSISNHYWRETMKWKVSNTPSTDPADKVVKALRDAQSTWTNNINWCGSADKANGMSDYDGRSERTLAHDGANTVDWGNLEDTQSCSQAIACTVTWYDEDGYPVEFDIRFSGAVRWSVDPEDGAYDIQSIAVHEFGHVRQFGHVSGTNPDANTVVMWPYMSKGDTSGRKLGKGDSIANNESY